jgi:hypothetical protein
MEILVSSKLFAQNYFADNMAFPFVHFGIANNSKKIV